MADIVTMAKDELKVRGKADAAALATRAVSGEADGTELTASQDQIPTWRQRDFSAIPVGSPYKWNGIVYKLWQQPHHRPVHGRSLCAAPGYPGDVPGG